MPAPWRATETEPQSGQRAGTRSRWPQWWQASVAARAVQHERDVAVRALHDLPAGAAGEEVRPAAPVEQHDRLLAASADAVERLARRAGAAAGRAAAMSTTSTGGSGRPSTRSRQLDPPQRVEALGPRRRAAREQHGARRAARALGATSRAS